METVNTTSPPPAADVYARQSLVHMIRRELGELYRFRPLLRALVTASLRTENVGTIFGYLWWLLHPLFLMIGFVILIDVMLRSGGPDYPVFVFTSVIAWKHFSAGATNAIVMTQSKEQQMRQVMFPKAVLPIAAIAAETARFLFGLGVLALAAVGFGIMLHYTLPLVLVVAAVQVLVTLAVGFFLSALNIFFRDVRNISGHLFNVWFYLSPGLYPLAAVPEQFRDVLGVNPFSILLPAYHSIILDHAVPDIAALATTAAAAGALLVVAFAVFVRLEPSFAKVS